MQGQRAEPDQERENKHDRSQQDFQNELHIFINSFAYILQFNRSRGKDAAERDGIGAAAPLFDACKLYQYPIRHIPKLLLILDDLLQICTYVSALSLAHRRKVRWVIFNALAA